MKQRRFHVLSECFLLLIIFLTLRAAPAEKLNGTNTPPVSTPGSRPNASAPVLPISGDVYQTLINREPYIHWTTHTGKA